MNKGIVLAAAALLAGSMPSDAQTMIGKSNIQLQSDCMSPEALWAMGRIGGCAASPDGKKIAYQVGYYSVKENKGHQMLYVMDADGKNQRQLTQTAKSETDVAWIDGGKRLASATASSSPRTQMEPTGNRCQTPNPTLRDSVSHPMEKR